MQNQLFIYFFTLIFLFSCSKDDEIQCPPDSEPTNIPEWNYPTAIGSYWVYDWYSVDSLGTATLTNQKDTVKIIGDSLLNGNMYAIYSEQFFSSFYNDILRRDSSGFIVNQFGQVDYSYVEFDVSYNAGVLSFGGDPLYVYNIMKDTRETVVTVPLGEFSAVDREVHFYYEGSPVLNPCGDTEFVDHRFHVPGVGEIKSTSFYTGAFEGECSTIERRLIEYYIPE